MARMHTTKNDLSQETREKIIALLNQQLADTFDLYSQTKQAHWNVKGPQFFQLHELFDQLATEVLGYVDLIAERITTLGGTAQGTVRMSAEATRMTDYPLETLGSMESVATLSERYAHLAATTRAGIDTAMNDGDADTADLLTQVSRGLDKSLWFLEAHIQE
jgi:starvation-inducible DNA-binding protein